MPQHPILPPGTRVRVTDADPEDHADAAAAVVILGHLGTVVSYHTTYPEYHCYHIAVDECGVWTLFDDEFEPLD